MDVKLNIFDEGSAQHNLSLMMELSEAEAHALKVGDTLHFRQEEGDFHSTGVFHVKVKRITKLLGTNLTGVTGMIVQVGMLEWYSIKPLPPVYETLGGLLDAEPLLDTTVLNIAHYRREQDRE